MGPRRLETGSQGREEGAAGETESKALVPGPQGWGVGIKPWTHSPEQKSRSRSPSQERPYGGTGFGRKSRPGPPGSGTFLSRPFVCTESLSDEEPHLGVGQTRRGQGRSGSLEACAMPVTCPPPTDGAGLPVPSKDDRIRQAKARLPWGSSIAEGPRLIPPKKRSQGFNRNTRGPP